MENQQVNLAALRQPKDNQVVVGFDSAAGYDLLLKIANNFSKSSFVPDTYKGDAGLPSCVVAVDMAIRMKAAPLMVMQNLYLVNGKPGWSAQWCIGQVNNCGRFSPLEYDIVEYGPKEVEYTVTKWENKQRVYDKRKITIDDIGCTAYATELRTGKIIRGVEVSMEMAVKEGWYGKDGSKWQTMPDLMLRYRSASFFCKLYAPELLMGLQTAEELRDIIEVANDGQIVESTVSLQRKPKKIKNEQTVTNPETGEILPKDEIATENYQMTPEEMNQSMQLIEEIKKLREEKTEKLKTVLTTEKTKELDILIDKFFHGKTLEYINQIYKFLKEV